MAKRYYKQIIPQLATFFYVDTDTDNVGGMFRECRMKDTLSITRVRNVSLWENVSNNELAKTFLNSSIEISEAEYKAAEFVMETFVDCDYWYITEDKMPKECQPQEEVKQEELVIEPIYV